MCNVPNRQNNSNNGIHKLMAEKSNLLFRANAHASSGCKKEASMLFEQTAEKEQEIARLLEDAGHSENAIICWMNAASHYGDAGKYSIAVSLLEKMLSRPVSGVFKHEIERKRERYCQIHNPSGIAV